MIARTVGWGLLLTSLGEVVLRQLARWSPLTAISGADDLSPWSAAALAVVGLAVAAGRGDAAVWRRRRAGIALAVALFTAGGSAQLRLGARLQSDGFFYYSFTRSIWFDRDLDLTNDYALLGIDDAQHQFLLTPTVTGYAHSAWAIGPALAWSPFMAAGHVSAVVLAARGHDVKTDGTSFPYRQAVCLAGLFYGLLGLWWSYRLAREWSGVTPAALAGMLIGTGTFLLWYLVREPTMSHSVSMASVAGFTLAWVRSRASTDWRVWTLLGLAGGVMVIMRWQNAMVLLLPTALLWRRPRTAVAFAAGVFVGTCPQLWTWHALYGEWITHPPVSPRMLWTQSQWVDVLWSSRSGLFATSPAAYLGAIGLVPLWRRHRALAATGLLTLVLMTWTNGAVEDWWAGASFGGRRFDSVLPFLLSGAAALIVSATEMVRRRPLATATAVLSCLVVWNVTLMAVARAGAYRIGQIVSFGDLAGGQAAVAHEWFGHLPSMPASTAWAISNGLHPSRFDLLRPNRFLGDPTRPYGRVDVGGDDRVFLGEGWHDAERDGDLTFRWTGQAAHLIVPLAQAAPLWLQLQVRPFDADGLPPQTLTAWVNGVALPAVTLQSGWQRVEVPSEAGAWRPGVNHVRLQFGRQTRPLDVGGGDGRWLSAAVDYVRVQKR